MSEKECMLLLHESWTNECRKEDYISIEHPLCTEYPCTEYPCTYTMECFQAHLFATPIAAILVHCVHMSVKGSHVGSLCCHSYIAYRVWSEWGHAVCLTVTQFTPATTQNTQCLSFPMLGLCLGTRLFLTTN